MLPMTLRLALAAAGLSAILSSAAGDEIDLKRLPLGDGKISQGPKAGWVWACRVNPHGGGAHRVGPWINKAEGTFDFTAKTVVRGSVRWPHRFKITVEGDKRVFTLNDLPNHPTGTFPIARDDPAYRYDRNPNRITAKNFRLAFPVNPEPAPAPTCAPGSVGILLSGVVLYNALDLPGRDAVAHETQDLCQGHPQRASVYHYHSLSNCIDDKPAAEGHSKLLGYAIDGFGIFGNYSSGKRLASADLDGCHGHPHAIPWDGKTVEMYHYHATPDYPYTVGCMRGRYERKLVRLLAEGPGGGPPRGGPRGRHPDLAAAARKLGINRGRLQRALGPPPPDLAVTARRLGISEARLRAALGVP